MLSILDKLTPFDPSNCQKHTLLGQSLGKRQTPKKHQYALDENLNLVRPL